MMCSVHRCIGSVMLALLVYYVAGASVPPPGSVLKKELIVPDENATLKLQVVNIQDDVFVTGTGLTIMVTAIGSYTGPNETDVYSNVKLESIDVEFPGTYSNVQNYTVRAYPFPKPVPPDPGEYPEEKYDTSGMTRTLRWNTLASGGSVDGIDATIKAVASFKLIYCDPTKHLNENGVPMTSVIKSVTVTVRVKIVNAILLNGTNAIMSGGDPPGWWPVNQLPVNLTWSGNANATPPVKGMSQQMTEKAREKIPNHAIIVDSLHADSDLHLKTEMMQAPASLFSKATLWFCSSHGYYSGTYPAQICGGVYDNLLAAMSWSNIGLCFGSSNVSTSRSLGLNMAFLYNCGSGSRDQLVADLLKRTGYSNAALFGFAFPVYSTLRSEENGGSDLLEEYNSGPIVTMLDPLVGHTDSFLDLLCGTADRTAASATLDANLTFPPRAFAYHDNFGVNQMKDNPLVCRGDGNARLHTVYRPEAVGTYKLFGNDNIYLGKSNKTGWVLP